MIWYDFRCIIIYSVSLNLSCGNWVLEIREVWNDRTLYLSLHLAKLIVVLLFPVYQIFGNKHLIKMIEAFEAEVER